MARASPQNKYSQFGIPFNHTTTDYDLKVVDMPLLFETGSFRLMNKSVVVWCDQNQQVRFDPLMTPPSWRGPIV